jgi:hypothetical protein
MNDDYLWDRSGEPDPEVERLERVLVNYRYQPKPLSTALRSQLSPRRSGWIKLTAIAAAILIVLAGLWIFKVQNHSVPTTQELANKGVEPQNENKGPDVAPSVKPPDQAPEQRIARKVSKASKIRQASPRPAAEPVTYVDSDLVAERQPIINPFIDVETARHIERAQLLLRAFRNTRDGNAPDSDLAYEKQRSRGLLSKNILLRRDAEAKGNMPVEELLGSLEPFLLDIANLGDRPSTNDVRSIKERMQKKEIVSALQVYSAPTLSQVF